MLALSVRQPWADLLVLGIKDVENRSWRCPKGKIGRRVAIHAGLRYDREGFESVYFNPVLSRAVGKDVLDFLQYFSTSRTGCFVGSVEIAGCYEYDEDAAGVGSPWACGRWCFRVRHPLRYKRPVDGPGRLGFWWETDSHLVSTENQHAALCGLSVPVQEVKVGPLAFEEGA